MSFILGGSGVITDPVNAPIDITANTAAPYYATIAYTWNITNLDDYTTYTLSTTNGTIVRSSATLTYTPASAGAGGWTMNGRTINLTILNYVNFIQKLTGGNGRQLGVDSSGNIYVTNSSFGAAKLSSLGVLQWSRRTTIAGGTFYNSYTDSSGNTYLTGFNSTTTVTLKYDSSGALQWQKTLNQGASTVSQAVTSDSANSVIIAGYAFNPSSDNDCLIAKYNSAGVLQWQRILGSVGTAQQFFGVATDSSNNIVGVGYDALSLNIIVAKYNSAGTIQWQVAYISGNSTPAGVAIDSSGNIFVAGAAGSLTKFNASGTLQWSRVFSGPTPTLNAVTLDPSGNPFVIGQVTVGGFLVYFFAKYNTSGVIQWQRTLAVAGVAASGLGYGIAADSSNVFVNGQWPGGGYLDAVVPTDGSKTGSYTVAGSTVNYAAGALTEAAAGYSASASGFTDSATAFTDATSAFVDSALALTSSITPI